MIDRDQSRRTDAVVQFDGVDISQDVRKHLLSLTYTDNEEGEADDLQIKIEDRDALWLCKWLNDMVEAAASAPPPSAPASGGVWAIGDAVTANGHPQYTSYGEGKPGRGVTNYSGNITHLNLKSGVPFPIHVGQLGWFAEGQIVKPGAPVEEDRGQSAKGLCIQAKFQQQNWSGRGRVKSLDCGQFELDCIDVSGPPSAVTIKATSLPYRAQIRQTKKSKAWEAVTLSQIATEMATTNGMTCLFESPVDPYYKRVEQMSTSDIDFLSTLCEDAGISLKATGSMLVLFDQVSYEVKATVMTIRQGDGSYLRYKLSTGQADTQYSSCRVSYVNPATGAPIEGIAYTQDYDSKSKKQQQLQVTAKISSIGEAEELAKKRLRLHNKFEKTASFTFPGMPHLVAGCTIQLEDWGAWDGKYMIQQAVHSLSGSGYTTQIKLRQVLEGY